MDNKKFTSVIEARLESLKALLIKKGEEYATDKDRLHNFKSGAAISGDHEVRVLDGMLLKHYISYRDMLKDIEAGKTIDYAYLNEKVGDILAYYLIFEALVLDTATVTNVPEEFEEPDEIQTTIDKLRNLAQNTKSSMYSPFSKDLFNAVTYSGSNPDLKDN